MRIRLLAVTAALLLGALSTLPRGHAAPEGWSLAHRVPASTLGYAALEDVGSWKARFEQTAIYKLATHPDMQAFLEPLTQGVEGMLAGRGGPVSQMPPSAQKLLNAVLGVNGDVSVAVTSLDETTGMPQVVASLDFRDNIGEFGKFLGEFRTEVDPESKHIQYEMRDGRPYWSIDADGVPITGTIFDSAFLISNSSDTLSQVVAGTVAQPLASAPTYGTVRTQAGADDLAVFAYVNMPPLLSLLQEQAGPEVAPMVRAMGLEALKGAGVGISFAGDGFRDALILHAPHATSGLFGLMRYQPVPPEALKWVPADAFYYAEGKATLDTYLAGLKKLMGDIEPNAVEQVDQMLQHINTSIGVDLDKEILQQMDGHTCFYASMPSTGGLFPEVVMLLKAKDAAVFEANVKRLVDGVAGMLTEEGDALASTRTLTFRDHTLHLLDLEGPRRGRMVPLTPTWTRLADNWFAVTLVPHTMKELILRVSGTGEAGLAQQEDFRAVMSHKPAAAGSVGYIDLQGLAALLYDTGAPLLQMLAKPNMLPEQFPPLDFALLPPTRVIRPYLRSAGLFSTWDDNGMSLSSQGPIPMGMVFVGAVAASVMVPMIAMRRQAPGFAPPPIGIGGGPGGPGNNNARLQIDIAKMMARDAARHVRSYLLQNGALPTSLSELVKVEMLRKVPTDAWQNPFWLVVTDAEKNSFQIVSAGPDGKRGTDDDIAVDG